MEAVMVLVFVAGAVALIKWGAARAAQRQAQWKQTAEGLGLSLAPGPHSARPVYARRHMPEIYGQYDGQDVYIGVRVYTTGSGKNQQTHYYTYVDVLFDCALKRGAQIGRADGVSKFFGDIFGQRDLQTGQPQLDREYRIKGQDPAQLIGLVSSPKLAALLLVDHKPFRTYVTDAYVRLEATGVRLAIEDLRPLLAPSVTLFREVVAAWTALPPSSEELRVEPAWRRACERAHLAYAARGMRGLGRVRDVDARMEVVLHDKHGWSTELAASFDPDLAVGLAITREGAIANVAKLFGAQDITTGDVAFDERFLIKGKDPELVKQILVADARAGLLELHAQCDELEISDTSVVVRLHRIVDDPEQLAAVLTAVTDAANHMVAHRKVASTGVYR